MPTVSIIIPAYNPGAYLEMALASVAAQTFTDWEMIVVDDGSTEDIQPIVSRYPGARLIQQENRGLSIARNVGILEAKGEYIAFLDADDVWLPGKLEKQIALMRGDPRCGLCQTQFEIVDSEGNYRQPGYARPVGSYAELLEGCGVCISSVVVRRKCLSVGGLFDPFITAAQDYDMWLKIARYYGIGLVSSVETQYRWHGSNMSHHYRRTYAEITTLFHKHIALNKVDRNPVAQQAAQRGLKLAHKNYSAQAFDHCRKSLHQRNAGLFLSHLGYSFRLSPTYATRSVLSYFGMKRRKNPVAGNRESANTI